MSELEISLMFTNIRIKNRKTRIKNHREPQYSLTKKSEISYFLRNIYQRQG